MTIDEAKELKSREALIYVPDGSRWYVNGVPITWKTRPNDVKVPIKHGLWSYDYLDHHNAKDFVKE